MVVGEFDVVGAAVAPGEAEAILVVASDAVLPSRGGCSFSSRLPGGMRRSLMFSAASRICILRRAALASVELIPFGRRSSQTFWVSLSLNDRITRQC